MCVSGLRSTGGGDPHLPILRCGLFHDELDVVEPECVAESAVESFTVACEEVENHMLQCVCRYSHALFQFIQQETHQTAGSDLPG